ncbi:RNA polymerase sigma factor [Nakamurella leprariae]|uniref:Sigma-70 family RNA polymerase sigma factor n=1 Tax=Nakamurella leprariae TaxID=2803911 RepID=A0A938YBA4_9ACTN|nr:sigma-70 family RNA polymerase sigma factor [Nakamurella leprariae]MBM9466639.1 sigma-70 family RNA polymerase sigma factor [Nakamurella leprariae]
MVPESERAAFEQTYRTHASSVFSHFLQRGMTRTDAEDLTAEVFATAWRRHGEIEPHPEAGMLPWLLGTANNMLRAKRRSLWRAHRALARVERPADVPDLALDVTQAAEDQARLAVLIEVLRGLSTAEQEVIQFCVIRGISPTVVAQVTGEPAGTVRSRLSRALAKARVRFAELTDAAPDPGRTGGSW